MQFQNHTYKFDSNGSRIVLDLAELDAGIKQATRAQFATIETDRGFVFLNAIECVVLTVRGGAYPSVTVSARMKSGKAAAIYTFDGGDEATKAVARKMVYLIQRHIYLTPWESLLVKDIDKLRDKAREACLLENINKAQE